MQTHPRPTPERLSPDDLSPQQPTTREVSPPAEAPVVEERTQPQAVPVPSPNPIVEELSPPPVEIPIAPANTAPTNTAPNGFGSEPIEAFPQFNEPVSVPDEQGQPLSEDWIQQPLSWESTIQPAQDNVSSDLASSDLSATVEPFRFEPTVVESSSKAL
jgi:hypothetical protein